MRDVNGLKGLHAMRSMHSAKKSSIPKIQNSAYLDLYLMNKEKERLLKEGERLGSRNNVIEKRLGEINHQMSGLQEAENKDKANISSRSPGRASTHKDGIKKEWKKMALNY